MSSPARMKAVRIKMIDIYSSMQSSRLVCVCVCVCVCVFVCV